MAVRDVLRYLAGSAVLPAEVSRRFDIGGPDVLTYAQMTQRTEQAILYAQAAARDRRGKAY